MNVEKTTVEREVVKKVTETEDAITLTLTLEEARALQAAVGTMGGTVRENNLRDVTDSIYYGLSKAGIDWFGPGVQKYAKNIKQKLRVGTPE